MRIPLTIIFGALPALLLAIGASYVGAAGILALFDVGEASDLLYVFGALLWTLMAWWGALSLWAPVLGPKPLPRWAAMGLIMGIVAEAVFLVPVVDNLTWPDQVDPMIWFSALLLGFIIAPSVVAIWYLKEWTRAA